jgi:AraC-like DNA-binding protein
MSLYISDRQINHDSQGEQSYVPILLESLEVRLKHRIFPPYYEFSKILLDSYEIHNRDGNELIYPIMPTGCVSLAFILGSLSYANILGAATAIRDLRVPPQTIAFCIRLHPGSFGCFSRVPASELTNQVIPLENHVHHTADLINDLRHGESFHERNVLFQRFLVSIRAENFKPMDIVRKCIELIHANQGMIKILQLALTLGCSERYLNRVFQARVGVSPKQYCELTQLQCSLKEIITTKPKSLLNIAISYGYFDQTHMNRSYRKFLDCTASDMRYLGRKDLSLSEISTL